MDTPRAVSPAVLVVACLLAFAVGQLLGALAMRQFLDPIEHPKGPGGRVNAPTPLGVVPDYPRWM